MQRYSRRDFLISASLAAAGIGFFPGCRQNRDPNGDRDVDPDRKQGQNHNPDRFKIGVIDINGRYGGLARTARIDAVEKAARIGFEGVEITFGGPDEDGMLLLAREERQQRYMEELDRHGIKAAGTHLFVLHQNLLKDPDDPLARKWVEQAIPATHNLNAEVILLPFFGDGAIETTAEMHYVADLMNDLGAMAQDYGVILGLENTLSAEDNMRILDRANSPAVKVYYDTGNSHGFGHDIYSEIRRLGSERICQFHLKDNPHYMGEGEIDFDEVFRIIDEIGYSGWLILETTSPTGNRAEDLRRNLEFTKNTLSEIR